MSGQTTTIPLILLKVVVIHVNKYRPHFVDIKVKVDIMIQRVIKTLASLVHDLMTRKNLLFQYYYENIRR